MNDIKKKSVSDKCDTNKKKVNFGPAKKAVPQECVGKHRKRSEARPIRLKNYLTADG